MFSRFVGNNVGAAAPALERLGAEGPLDPGYHGSFAFSGCTGTAPRFYTRTEVRPRYHGPSIVAQLIPTPASQKGLYGSVLFLFLLMCQFIFCRYKGLISVVNLCKLQENVCKQMPVYSHMCLWLTPN